MLETWRALAHLARTSRMGSRIPHSGRPPGILHQTEFSVRPAQWDAEWLGTVLDENSEVKPRELLDWFRHKGGFLVAGIDLFNHHARGTGNSIQASPLVAPGAAPCNGQGGTWSSSHPQKGWILRCSTTESAVEVWPGMRTKEGSSSCPKSPLCGCLTFMGN